jgi:hypothetical protein
MRKKRKTDFPDGMSRLYISTLKTGKKGEKAEKNAKSA